MVLWYPQLHQTQQRRSNTQRQPMKRLALVLGLLTTISVHAQSTTEAEWLPALQQKYVGHKVIVGSDDLHCIDQVATVQQITPPLPGTGHHDQRTGRGRFPHLGYVG